MKEAFVSNGPKVRIVDSPVPKPEADQVVIKVIVSGSNPKDWKYTDGNDQSMNAGDDIAGIVHAVGEGVLEFRPGDRVAAFHQMVSPHGSFAEYAISWAHTCFHIPQNTSFEEAATIPLAAMTAAFGLYQSFRLPPPWNPAETRIPLIIYGASSAVGLFAIQFAVQSNIHPLICVAGKAIAQVEKLIDKSQGDQVLDYRVGLDKLASDLKTAIAKTSPDGKCYYAYDTIVSESTFPTVYQALDQSSDKSQLATTAPRRKYDDVPKHITVHPVYVGDSHRGTDMHPITKRTNGRTKVGNEEFAYVYFRYISRGLQQGFFSGIPYEVRPGGLEGIEQALADLKAGKASAVKYVFRIANDK